jgi:hypothetical protein
MKTIWIYVNTSKQVGDPEHIKIFTTKDSAEHRSGKTASSGGTSSVDESRF